MKVLPYGQFYPAALVAPPSHWTLRAVMTGKLRHARTRLRAWRRYRARAQRYEDLSLLDRRVLEEIGVTREQISYDACQPVWWR